MVVSCVVCAKSAVIPRRLHSNALNRPWRCENSASSKNKFELAASVNMRGNLQTQPTLAALAQGVCKKLPLISMALTCILGGWKSWDEKHSRGYFGTVNFCLGHGSGMPFS